MSNLYQEQTLVFGVARSSCRLAMFDLYPGPGHPIELLREKLGALRDSLSAESAQFFIPRPKM